MFNEEQHKRKFAEKLRMRQPPLNSTQLYGALHDDVRKAIVAACQAAISAYDKDIADSMSAEKRAEDLNLGADAKLTLEGLARVTEQFRRQKAEAEMLVEALE